MPALPAAQPASAGSPSGSAARQTPASGSRPDIGRARAGRLGTVWTALSAWSRGLGGDLGWRSRWPHLLAALAGGGNGWNTPPPGHSPSAPPAGAARDLAAQAVLPGTGQPRPRPLTAAG